MLLWQRVSPLKTRAWPADLWYCLEPSIVVDRVINYRLREFPAIVGLLSTRSVLHLPRRPRCSLHLTSCALSARSSSSARYRAHCRTLFRRVVHSGWAFSVRCTTSSRCPAGKRSSRLACQDTAPSVATSSPSLDALASSADTSSLNSVRARLSYLNPCLWTDSSTWHRSPNGYSGHSSVP